MAKEKFHTSHHTERRYHKHGIKKVPVHRYAAVTGVRHRMQTRLGQPEIPEKQEESYQIRQETEQALQG